MMESLPASLGPHYWNFPKSSLIPYCCLPRHRLRFRASAELLGNWHQRGGPSKDASRAALLPPVLVKLGTGYST